MQNGQLRGIHTQGGGERDRERERERERQRERERERETGNGVERDRSHRPNTVALTALACGSPLSSPSSLCPQDAGGRPRSSAQSPGWSRSGCSLPVPSSREPAPAVQTQPNWSHSGC